MVEVLVTSGGLYLNIEDLVPKLARMAYHFCVLPSWTCGFCRMEFAERTPPSHKVIYVCLLAPM